MNFRRTFAMAALALAATAASAQTLKPGLWEISNKMGGSPEMDKAMAQMQQQLASMPPEQRKMMQDMMARQGVSMGGPAANGGMTVKICMTREMVERNEMPQPQQGDCKTTMSPRSGNTQKIAFTCTQPPSSGEGQVTYLGPEAYAMKMTTQTSVQGKPQTVTMDGGGKWLSADCGAIKPLTPPKK